MVMLTATRIGSGFSFVRSCHDSIIVHLLIVTLHAF